MLLHNFSGSVDGCLTPCIWKDIMVVEVCDKSSSSLHPRQEAKTGESIRNEVKLSQSHPQ
jgi:hypothetical protein